MTINEFHKWALPASIALLSGSVVIAAAIVSAPLFKLANDPIRVDNSGVVNLGGELELSSFRGLGGGY